MEVIYLSAGLVAIALVGLQRWAMERRTARWQQVMSMRLSGYMPLDSEDATDELAAPYVQRVIIPKLSAFRTNLARRITPANFHRDMDQKLRLAGVRQTAEVYFLTRIASAVAALLVVGVGAWLLPGVTREERLLAPIVVALLVFVYPGIHLNTKVQQSLAEIDKSLPEVFDLLSVSVEAGLAFDGALRQVVANVDGPVRDEFHRVLADMQLGIPRAEALASLAKRTELQPLKRFAALVAQSDRTGSSISAALKIQAKDIKEYRASKAREKAASIPIKIIFPMVSFIFPAMFVIILGPAVISVMKLFHL